MGRSPFPLTPQDPAGGVIYVFPDLIAGARSSNKGYASISRLRRVAFGAPVCCGLDRAVSCGDTYEHFDYASPNLLSLLSIASRTNSSAALRSCRSDPGSLTVRLRRSMANPTTPLRYCGVSSKYGSGSGIGFPPGRVANAWTTFRYPVKDVDDNLFEQRASGQLSQNQ